MSAGYGVLGADTSVASPDAGRVDLGGFGMGSVAVGAFCTHLTEDEVAVDRGCS